LAEWREDIEAFLSLEMIDAIVISKRHELPRIENAQYFGFIDPSGGRQDSFTLAICHKEEKGKCILDYIREIKPPFQPGAVVMEFSEILKSYGIYVVESDRYAGEWVTSSFRENGIMVESSEFTSSEIYLNFLPLVANSSVELLDNKRLIEQLRGLERKTRVGGKDQITHAPFAGAHDDLAIAVAGVLVRAARNAGVVRDNLEEIWATVYSETREERFNRYIQNWLLDKPQKPWTAEDDMGDFDDFL
jgi:hypothetical protein